jgi:LysR family glycine cleavage system transcriptional activator
MNSRLIKLVQASPFLAAMHVERNFTKAAEALGVHQTAVSHRIRAVEEMLGIRLFERTTRTLTFTHAGEVLCKAAYSSVKDLEETLERVMQTRMGTTIRVSVPPSLAMKWMVPELPHARSAGLSLSVQAQTHLVDFARGEADVAVRYGKGPYPGLRCIRLGISYMQALASPAYVKEKGTNPSDPWSQELDILQDHVTETDAILFGWREYAAAEPNFRQSLEPASLFDRTDLALQAAINGMGVALGRTLLFEADVKNGFLVPIGRPHAVEPSDWLVCSYEFAETRKFQDFHDWIVMQMEETRAIMDGFFPRG